MPDAPADSGAADAPTTDSPPAPAPAPVSAEPAPSGPDANTATTADTSNSGAEVEALRAEVAEWRTKVEGAQQGIVDKIAAALGLGGADETPTVEQVTEQLTAAQRDARERAVDLAVYRAAGTAGVDPDALLDSTGFRRRVADLDPAAEGFAGQVASAITEALQANPRLAASPAGSPAVAPPAPRSGGQITGGSPSGSDDLGSLSVEDYIKRTRKGRS
jgi:hypothetical protein